jgi:glycosyltransferase involved in cell wall biosynthesis
MISIITPTYNRAHLLPRMVESVLAQSFQNWELIVIDDGSTDNTYDIIATYKDERIKYFYTENSGAADSRNEGVKKAINNFIIFLDSDDEVKLNWLEKFEREIFKNNAKVITCGCEKYDDKGELLKLQPPEKLGSFYGNHTVNFLSGTFMFEKKIFLKCKGYDTKLTSGQHTDLFLRLIPIFKTYNLKIAVINEILVKLHIHDGARIRHNHNAVYVGSIRMLEKHKKIFQIHKDDYYDYLSTAGVSAIRIKKHKEGRQLLLKALILKPFKIKAYVRVLISQIPLFRKTIWKS